MQQLKGNKKQQEAKEQKITLQKISTL